MNEIETLSSELEELRKEISGLREDVRRLRGAMSDLNDTGSAGLIGAIMDLKDALNKHRKA